MLSLSEIMSMIDVGSFLSYDNITVSGLRKWGTVNNKSFTNFTDKELSKIIEYIQDKEYEKR